jgi:tetratricopeptide (TPR) repeat protein
MFLVARVQVFALLLIGCGSESTPSEAAPTAPPAPAVTEGEAPTPAPATPARVESPGDPVAVARGLGFACVLRRGGRVACWGINNEGQLGLGHTNPVAGAVEVEGLDDAVAIAPGVGTACAVRRTGSVVCWGSNRYGSLGAGDSSERRGLVSVTGLTDATALAPAGTGFCAIRREGRVSCWGRRHRPVIPPGSDESSFALIETTLRDVRALRVADGSEFALLTGSRAMTWGYDGATIPLHELQDVANVVTGPSAACVQNVAGEVRCRVTGAYPRDEVMDAARGATAMRISGSLVALMPEGRLVMLAPDGARQRLEPSTDIAQLAIESFGPPTAIARDGRVLEWSANPTPEGVLVATEITLPALGSTPAVAPLPEGPIPRWCRIDARWAPLSEPVSLEALYEEILDAPRDDTPYTRGSLCESAEVAYGSPDCPTDGPWLAQSLDGELTLVVAQAGGLYARLPELAQLSDGTEENSALGRWELVAARPLDAGLSIDVSEQVCLDEENFQDCGLADAELVHTVLREVEGRILRVTATIDRRRAPPEAELISSPPTLEVSGSTLNLWVCGGHARFPLPAAPSTTSDTGTAPATPATPATEAEAQAAAAQCAEGWRAFGAGDFDTARATIDAALEVLERAQDARGLRARGACLYNRGRVAEQDADVRAARGYYQRSLEARPNEVVRERWVGLL